MRYRNPDAILVWLQSGPGLRELRERFPRDWAEVHATVTDIIRSGRPEQLKAMSDALDRTEVIAPPKNGALSKVGREALVSEAIRGRMLAEYVKSQTLAVAAGKTGRFKLNFWSGFLAQKLLFVRNFERRPVSRTLFRVVWPFVWQRRLVMPLVQQRGIYCFYSKELVVALAGLIGEALCLEVAAGDGTLSRFLRECGVNVIATDNRSWSHAIDYPEDVLACDAVQALAQVRPGVVLCSWPPPDNGFERAIFATPSVNTYIVIGSKMHSAFGNWAAYARQNNFEMSDEAGLAKLVLPPELQSAVYVFRRRKRTSGN